MRVFMCEMRFPIPGKCRKYQLFEWSKLEKESHFQHLHDISFQNVIVILKKSTDKCTITKIYNKKKRKNIRFGNITSLFYLGKWQKVRSLTFL